jgi:hypothetical protein
VGRRTEFERFRLAANSRLHAASTRSMLFSTGKRELTLEQLDVPLVLAFLDDLEKTRGNSPRSQRGG